MPDLLVHSFAPLLLAFQSCFTQPSFGSFWALACAWILCAGRRSLTRIPKSRTRNARTASGHAKRAFRGPVPGVFDIQSAQLTQCKHYCSFHRFCSQARWDLDDLGHCVFQLLLPFCAEVDDTLARKS